MPPIGFVRGRPEGFSSVESSVHFCSGHGDRSNRLPAGVPGAIIPRRQVKHLITREARTERNREIQS